MIRSRENIAFDRRGRVNGPERRNGHLNLATALDGIRLHDHFLAVQLETLILLIQDPGPLSIG